jgi:hypothetical protein
VRDGLFGDRRLREHLDIPVGLHLPEEGPDLTLVEGDDRVVLPALAVARRRLGKAVLGLEALDDGGLERAEKGPGDDADPRLVDRLVEDRPQLVGLRASVLGRGGRGPRARSPGSPGGTTPGS